MKKELVKKISVFALLITFLLIILPTLVNAITVREFFSGAKEIGTGAFGTLFGETYGAGFWQLAIVKAMFFLLLFLIILAVADYIPLFSEAKPWIKNLLSAIISYLSVMYITPEEFYAILISYTTMGIVVSSIIPLAIILAITYKLASRPSAGKIILQKVLLGTFALMLIWRLLQIWLFEPEVEVPLILIPLYLGTLIIVTLLMIYNKWVRAFILSTTISGEIEVTETLSREEALADAMLLEERATALDKRGATNKARSLREAAARLKKHAKSIENLTGSA